MQPCHLYIYFFQHTVNPTQRSLAGVGLGIYQDLHTRFMDEKEVHKKIRGAATFMWGRITGEAV